MNSLYNSDNHANLLAQRYENLKLLYGLGYNLIPINGKNPPCIEFGRYCEERISPELICEWGNTRTFPKTNGGTWVLDRASVLNWAILSGAKPYSTAPALVVVDADDADAVALVRRRCPPTPASQTTPGGGRHFLYRRSAEINYLPNRQKTNFEGVQFNLDVRADKGYFMSPGSICPKRYTSYRWSEPWSLNLLNSIPMYDPAWIPLERPTIKARIENFANHDEAITQPTLTPLAMRIEQATKYIIKCPGSRAGAGADNYAFALATTLVWGFALPAEDAVNLLYDWGQQETNIDSRGHPYPWTLNQINHKIDNATHHEYRGEVGDRLAAYPQILEARAQRIIAEGK